MQFILYNIAVGKKTNTMDCFAPDFVYLIVCKSGLGPYLLTSVGHEAHLNSDPPTHVVLPYCLARGISECDHNIPFTSLRLGQHVFTRVHVFYDIFQCLCTYFHVLFFYPAAYHLCWKAEH